tara:strand:+ start:72 stop:605 length:534 start_codon:yes stop_codon:yes gene_type:complete
MTDPKDIKNLAAAALDANAQVDDLLRPTEERVREVVKDLRWGVDVGCLDCSSVAISPETADKAATLLETLSAEHKALREREQYQQETIDGLNGIITRQRNSGWSDPDTHVAVPREPMLSAINEIESRLDQARRAFHDSERWYDEGEDYTPTGQTYDEWINAAFNDARAMLTAAQEDK